MEGSGRWEGTGGKLVGRSEKWVGGGRRKYGKEEGKEDGKEKERRKEGVSHIILQFTPQ